MAPAKTYKCENFVSKTSLWVKKYRVTREYTPFSWCSFDHLGNFFLIFPIKLINISLPWRICSSLSQAPLGVCPPPSGLTSTWGVDDLHSVFFFLFCYITRKAFIWVKLHLHQSPGVPCLSFWAPVSPAIFQSFSSSGFSGDDGSNKTRLDSGLIGDSDDFVSVLFHPITVGLSQSLWSFCTWWNIV